MRLRKFLFIFLALFLLGADTPTLVSYPNQKIMGFRGLDSRSTNPTIADGRAEDLNNVKISKAFNLKKRDGYAVINDTLDDLDIDSPAITGIFDAEYSGDVSWTLAFVGSKLKYDASGTWTEIPYYNITSDKNYQWQCVMALDNAVCTNDNDVPINVSSTPTIAQTSFTGLTNPITKAKTSIWYRNYLIWGNTYENATERPTRFRWSNVGTIGTYTDADYIDIAELSGDEIIGFAELYGELYIFLKKSIWKVSLVGGDDVFITRKAVDGIGAIARDSVKVVQLSDNRTVVMFLDDRKKVLMFDGITVTDIGALIQPTLDNLNAARLQYAVATFDGESYYLCASSSGSTENDILVEFQTEIFEWTKHDQIDANAMAQVKESTSVIKTYFGNYDAFVYWMDDPDLLNDVDGATGIFDSTGIVNTATITGAEILIDTDLTSGDYTGAVVKITSGTGAGLEETIISSTATGIVVAHELSASIDSTSVYSIGAIDAYYETRAYDLGDATREKTFLGMLFWAQEASNSEVDVSYSIDFGSTAGSETKDLAPSSSSLWDSAIWDSSVWGTTGDKIYTIKFSGFGNFIQPKFENDEIDEDFNIYGYNIIGTMEDVKHP